MSRFGLAASKQGRSSLRSGRASMILRSCGRLHTAWKTINQPGLVPTKHQKVHGLPDWLLAPTRLPSALSRLEPAPFLPYARKLWIITVFLLAVPLSVRPEKQVTMAPT